MSIEAMKQALEALENCTTWHLTREQFDKNVTAITTLRTAIEQAEKAEPVAIDSLPRACNLAGVDYQTYLKIKAYMPVTPTAPVQEPVAITDAMAFAFHRALSDGAIGESEVEEIKAGLSAAFAHITTPPAAPVQEPYKGMSEHMAQATNGRIRIDQFTGDVGIGTPAAPVQDECVVCGDKVRVVPRPWVGLTDEQRNEIIFNAADEESATYQTEDKLRELNEGTPK